MMNNSQHQRQGQLQKHGYYMSQQHLKLMHLMHLSGFALQEYIENEIELNPALEVEQVEKPEDEEGIKTPETDSDFLMHADDDYTEKYISTPVSNQEFYENPVIQFGSLLDSLKEQLRMMPLSVQIHEISEYIIGELEEDGFLRRNLDAISYDYGFLTGKPVSIELIEKGLHAIQQCDPPGVGARTLRECLIIQLRRKGKISDNIVKISLQILENNFEDLAEYNLEKIQHELTINRETLELCVKEISKLSPKPLIETNKYELLRTQIVPEFEVTIEENQLYVALTSNEPIRVKVNEQYIKMMNSKKIESRKKQSSNYFQTMISDAQMLVNALRDRETTMMNVMKVIVQMQPEFFRSGDLKDLQPMILQDIAEKTGFDISAVSRITSNKHVQTPFGIFCLKNLFMRAVSNEENGKKSSTSIQVQELIQKIVEEENKNQPLSDSEIMALLKKREINVARRTIVKYRELAGIPNSTTRKKRSYLLN
jgi:RNA polymerase sigma-54 factor